MTTDNPTTAETIAHDINKSSTNNDVSNNDMSNNDKTFKPCILNGLLSYVNTVIRNSTNDNILKIVLTFYNSNDIILAKKLMWQTCDNKIIGDLVIRNNSRTRSQNEANAIDIIDAMKLLDRKSAIPMFAASATDKLPLRLPEELNLVCISERLSKVEAMISSQADTLVRHDNTMSKMRQFDIYIKDKLLTPDKKNMMNINADNKYNDISNNECRTPDAKIEKIVSTEQNSVQKESPMKSPIRKLTANDDNDKDKSANEASTRPKFQPRTLLIVLIQELTLNVLKLKVITVILIILAKLILPKLQPIIKSSMLKDMKKSNQEMRKRKD